jgi:hypothetical protein
MFDVLTNWKSHNFSLPGKWRIPAAKERGIVAENPTNHGKTRIEVGQKFSENVIHSAVLSI